MVQQIICFGQKYNNSYTYNGKPVWVYDKPLSLKNPAGTWIDNLTGLHASVRDWLDQNDGVNFDKCINEFITEMATRNDPIIGICCYGGRHRSAAVLIEACIQSYGGIPLSLPLSPAIGIPTLQFDAPEASRMYKLIQKYSDEQLATNAFIRGEIP